MTVKSHTPLGWKVFFWLNALLLGLMYLTIPQVSGLSPLDYGDLAISTIATLGLYGFAFSTPIRSVVFWRYFFYIALIDTLVYLLVLPAAGLPRYGQNFELSINYLLEILFNGAVLFALNQYAYKRSDIWKKNGN